jgi:anti-sigma B factor antagonist
MKIESKQENNVGIIHIKGKLIGAPETDDLHECVDKFLHHQIKQVIIDLKDVEWMGSVGLGALMRDLVTVCHAGGELLVANPSEKVSNLFKITKLSGVVKTFPGVKEALQHFNKHQEQGLKNS